MKSLVVFFAVLAIAFASDISDREEYDCIVDYLKSEKLLPATFNSFYVKPNDSSKCKEALNSYKSSVFETYSSIFQIHPKTESKVGCIMANFQKSDSLNYILLKFILEDARGNKTIGKEFFCKATKENDKIIEEKMRKSIHPCLPGFEFGSLFDSDAAADECRGDSSEFPTKVEVKLSDKI